MKRIDVVKIYMKKEGELPVANKKVTTPKDIYKIVKEFLGEIDREHLVVLVLNTSNFINSISIVSIGNLNSAILHPREIFKTAILSNGASIILAHNHPSGNSEPSKEDINVTKRIKECGELIGIDLLDHVIIGDDKFSSLKVLGMI